MRQVTCHVVSGDLDITYDSTMKPSPSVMTMMLVMVMVRVRVPRLMVDHHHYYYSAGYMYMLHFCSMFQAFPVIVSREDMAALHQHTNKDV